MWCLKCHYGNQTVQFLSTKKTIIVMRPDRNPNKPPIQVKAIEYKCPHCGTLDAHMTTSPFPPPGSRTLHPSKQTVRHDGRPIPRKQNRNQESATA